jgi:hypothetical protein
VPSHAPNPAVERPAQKAGEELEPMCQCPRCGRMHRDLQAGPPPPSIERPWERCPSTHCERRGECTSPSDCIVKSRPKAVERPADPRGWHEAIEAAAKVADEYTRLSSLHNYGPQGASRAEREAMKTAKFIAEDIRALSPAPKDREGTKDD